MKTKNEILAEMLRRRLARSAEHHKDFDKKLSPYQIGILLASISDKSHQEYVIRMQLSFEKELTSSSAIELVSSIFNVTPTLLQTVVEDNKSYEMRSKPFDKGQIEIIPYNTGRIKEEEIFNEGINVFSPHLYKVYLLESAEKKISKIYLFVHHLNFDGQSIAILEDRIFKVLGGEDVDLDEGYRAFNSRVNSKLSTLIDRAKSRVQQFKTADFEDIQTFGSRSNKELPSLSLKKEVISRFCNENRITVPALLYGVSAIIASSLSRNDKVILGTVFDNRNVDEVGYTGCFINTGMLIYDFSTPKTLQNLIPLSRQVLDDALETSEIPFYMIREELIRNGWGKDSIFQLFVNYVAGKNKDYQNKSFQLKDLPYSKSKFEMRLVFEESFDEIKSSMDGKVPLEWNWVSAFFELFESVLNKIISGEKWMLSDRFLFHSPEIETSGTYNGPFIWEHFAEHSKTKPYLPFIQSSKGGLTYEESSRIADKVSSLLMQKDVGKGDRVGILLDRSMYFIPTCLGIWKVSASYVPIDIRMEENRKRSIVSTANVKCYINLTDKAFTYENAYSMTDILESKYKFIEWPEASLSDEAYLLYSSGSTGEPKAISITHANISHYAQGLTERIGREHLQAISFGMISTPSADLGNTSILLAMQNGGAIFQFTYEESINPELFSQALANNSIDLLKVVPSHFFNLFNTSETNSSPKKILIFGGEAFDENQIISLREAQPDLRLFNHYGPTETTVGILCYEIHGQHENTNNKIPIGREFGSTQVLIADHNHRFIPTEFKGELLVYGPGVGKGYVLSAEKGYEEDKFGRYYSTGDIVYTIDNEFYFHSREDKQLKIHGVRLDLSTLDKALFEIFEASNFYVFKHSERLHVFHTPNDKVECDQLISLLKKKVPPLLVPYAIHTLDKLPVTLNGKIDTKTLTRIIESSDSYFEDVGESAAIHPAVIDAWNTFFPNQTSVSSTIYQVGGNSLIAARLLARINKEFDLEINLGSFLTNPCLSHLQKLVDFTDKGHTSDIGSLRNELSAFQERMFVINQVDTLSPQYNTPIFFSISDISRKEDIFEFIRKIYLHFNLLHAKLEKKMGYLQFVFTPDFDGVTHFCSKEELDRIYYSYKTTGIDLLKEAPFRLYVADRHFLLYFHHIIIDGVSKRFVLELIEAFLNGEEINLSSYEKYIPPSSPGFSPDTYFWRDSLTGFEGLDLSFDTSEGNQQVIHERIVLDQKTSEEIKRLCKNNNSFPKDYFLAVTTIVIGYMFNTSKFYQIIPVNTRTNEDEYKTIAPFIESMLFGISANPDEVFIEFLGRVKERFWKFFANLNLPFGEIISATNALNSDGTLVPNYMFAYEKTYTESKHYDLTDDFQIEANFPLSITVYEAENIFYIHLTTKENYVPQQKVNCFEPIMKNIVAASVEDQNRKLKDLPYAEGVTTCKFEGRNQQYSLLLEAYEGHVRKQPDAPLIIATEGRFSFQEIDQQSTRLAQKIYTYYASYQTIAVCLESHVDFVICVLAVMKSGKAFIPVDFKSRPQRRNSIKEIAHVTIDDAEFQKLKKEKHPECPLPRIEPDQVCYTILTSGTTGVPKIIHIPHSAIGNYLNWAADQYLRSAQHPIPLIGSLNYDLTITSYLLPLYAGNSLMTFDTQEVVQQLRQLAFKTDTFALVKMTPSQLRIFKNLTANPGYHIESLVLGGEALTNSIIHDMTCVETIFNEYGPAESTIGVSTFKLNIEDSKSLNENIPIGKPAYNNTIEIQGVFGANTLPFTHGELRISGNQVFAGYGERNSSLNNTMLTKDLMYFTDQLCFSKRIDDQLKIAGNRVDLTELKLQWSQFLRNSAFEIHYITVSGDNNLVCVFENEALSSIIKELKSEMKHELPDYMIPDFLLAKSAIVSSESGKTDWKKTIEQSTTDFREEETEKSNEDTVTRIWQRILGVSISDPDVNFFDAGGTSIQLFKLFAEFNKLENVNILLSQLLEHTTIRSQRKILDSNISKQKITNKASARRSRINRRTRQ